MGCGQSVEKKPSQEPPVPKIPNVPNNPKPINNLSGSAVDPKSTKINISNNDSNKVDSEKISSDRSTLKVVQSPPTTVRVSGTPDKTQTQNSSRLSEKVDPVNETKLQSPQSTVRVSGTPDKAQTQNSSRLSEKVDPVNETKLQSPQSTVRVSKTNKTQTPKPREKIKCSYQVKLIVIISNEY